MFPIITREIQKEFERSGVGCFPRRVPDICGYFGRACRQMEKEEGANRALCTGCPLAEYAKKLN